MKAIGNFLKKAAGGVFIFHGALMVFGGVIMVPPCLLGKLEGTYGENLMMAISFALMGASGVYLFRLGRKLCAGKKEPPITQKPAPAAEKPAEDKKTVPVEKPPETKKAAPAEKPAEGGTIWLKTHWGGAREHGEVRITLRKDKNQWNVHFTVSDYDEACNCTTRENHLTLALDYFETHDAGEVQELFASQSGSIRFDSEELCEKIPGLQPAPVDVSRGLPPLNQALESGDVGIGTREEHRDSAGNICYTMKGTPRVKYYWYADGTLVFVGRGASRSVEMGGFDGRNTYMPEPPPWSDTVCQGTRRAVFTEGITCVGSGLLQSLKNLEILDLADSVETVGYNSMKKLHVLRAGKSFKSFSGSTAPLTELKLPRKQVHFQYHNGGTLPGVTGATKEIQEELDRHLQLEFQKAMEQLFRACPEVGKKLSSMAALDKTFAAATISSLDWNSKYKTNRYVPEEDLWKFHGLRKNVKKGMDMATIHMKWEYGIHSFLYLASMAHAAMKAKPSRLVCYVDSLGVDFAALTAWWRREFPGIDLTVNRECGERIVVQNTGLPNSMPTRVETNPDPYRRASRPYEVAGPGRQSQMHEESRFLLFLSKANLAEKLEWGQNEYFAVDTRSMTPYYILEQYDGAVVAQSWYEIKEPMTWEELERYADPGQKFILGHEPHGPWSQRLAVHSQNQGDSLTLRWRSFAGGVREAALARTEDAYALEYSGADGKIRKLILSQEELKPILLQEKTPLPDYVCQQLCKNGRFLRLSRK